MKQIKNYNNILVVFIKKILLKINIDEFAITITLFLCNIPLFISLIELIEINTNPI